MNSPQPLYQIFDTATKVNSPWALAAFGIAAVVAIVYLWLSWSGQQDKQFRYRSRAAAIPLLAWVVLGIAIVVPVGAWAFVATHSDLPYLFRVVVYDKVRGLIQQPHVVCGAPGCIEQGVIDSAAQFQLSPSQLPAGNSVMFYADSENSRGKQSVVLGKARSVAVEVDIEPLPAPVTQLHLPTTQMGEPSHIKTSVEGKNQSAANAVIDSSWQGVYRLFDPHPNDGNLVFNLTLTIGQTGNVSIVWDFSQAFADSRKDCPAVWEGSATRSEIPQTIKFSANRPGVDSDESCGGLYIPASISGTVRRLNDRTVLLASSPLQALYAGDPEPIALYVAGKALDQKISPP